MQHTLNFKHIPGLTDQRFEGHVQHFHTDAYFDRYLFGFIQSPELAHIVEADVFAPLSELQGLALGDQVTFNVVLGRGGGLQARRVARKHGADGADANPPVASYAPRELGKFVGRVACTSAYSCFGLLESKELEERFRRPVLFSAADVLQSPDGAAGEVLEGTSAIFSAVMHAKGLLQAKSVEQTLQEEAAASPADIARRERILKACADRATDMLELETGGGISAAELADLAWSLASLKLAHEPLLNAIACRAMASISEFTVQGLSDTLWSVAALSLRYPPLFELIAAHALERIGEMHTSELAAIAWS